MTVPWWVVELARAFWVQVGGPEPFPRNLRRSIACAFPLAIVEQPSLSTGVVREWLRRRHIAYPLRGADRLLRACLIARGDGGVVFLDGSDEAAERRFSLAHELAHFLRHYWQPRRRACERLGDQVLAVFDGRRAPDPLERVQALFAGVPLGFHAHLMGRDARQGRPAGEVSVAEEEADRLAYELLAPAEVVAARLGQGSRDEAAAFLRESFGLPVTPANDYAELLLPAPPLDPLLRRLGLRA
jgi:hypothetical protein